MDPAVALEDVSRVFGPVVALAPLTLRLEPGAVGVVTGANGSGKTTLLRLVAGVLSPTTGSRGGGMGLYLRGGDGARAAQTVRQAVGFAAALCSANARTDHALAAVGLSALDGCPVRELSAGQHARITLAVALVCSPALTCLDEPTAHLDTAGCQVAGHVVAQLAAAGGAVLVATQDSAVFDPVADAHLNLRDSMLEAVA